MATLPFLKMQGIGNDFIVIDDLKPGSSSLLTPDRAMQICDRRFGVGADQILWLKPARESASDARMEILNADGSVAEMCGNGIRAVALYLYKHGPQPGRGKYSIETLAGVKLVEVSGDSVLVDMGVPKLQGGFGQGGEPITVGGRELKFFEVNVGNPHAVFFVENVKNFPVEQLGPLVENHPRFPKRTNVEFVEVESPESIRVRVWERGAGITLACGTGACASAVASMAARSTSRKLKIKLPGGELEISWAGEGKPVMMLGPAVEVFRGEIELPL